MPTSPPYFMIIALKTIMKLNLLQRRENPKTLDQLDNKIVQKQKMNKFSEIRR